MLLLLPDYLEEDGRLRPSNDYRRAACGPPSGEPTSRPLPPPSGGGRGAVKSEPRARGASWKVRPLAAVPRQEARSEWCEDVVLRPRGLFMAAGDWARAPVA